MASTNPTIPSVSEATGDTLQNTTDLGTGSKLIRHAHSPSDSPPVKTALTESEYHVRTLLGGGAFGTATNTPGPIQGLVIKTGTLQVGAFSLRYLLAGAEKTFLGETALAVTASQTNYVYLDSAATLKVSTSAFPASVFRLAKVVCGASDITSIEDFRSHNYDPGGTANWYNTQAADGVRMNNFGITDLEGIAGVMNIATISSGIISADGMHLRVRTEGAAATDDLDTINSQVFSEGPSGSGNFVQSMLIFLTPWNAGTEEVTVKDGTGNIDLIDGDFVMDHPDNVLCLMFHDGVDRWKEVARNETDISSFKRSVDGDGYNLTDLGAIAFRSVGITIAAGVATITNSLVDGLSFVRILNETGSSDDLDTIVGGQAQQFLVLKPHNAPTDVLVVKHSAVTDGILLQGDVDFTMDDTRDFLLLFYDGTNWHELARSKFRYEDLQSGHQRMSIQGFVSGALTAGVQKWAWTPHHAGKLNLFTCYVKTQPSGGSCIVNLNKNGTAIYASDGNAVNIAASTSSDTSDQTSPVVTFAANDRIEIEVKVTGGSPNGAADMTFTIDAEMDIK